MTNQTLLASLESGAADDAVFDGPLSPDSPELEPLLAEIARDAEARRQPGREGHPWRALALIRRARLGALRLPRESGGGGASLRELFRVVIRLAEADPDVAHILRAHYLLTDEFLRAPAGAVRDERLRRVAAGEIFGNAYTELSTKAVGDYRFETRLSPDGDGYRLNGTKYFSTGTLYADWVFVTASLEDGSPAGAIVPTSRPGVRILDDWDGIGQKYTGSGTTHFDDVRVERDEVAQRDTATQFNALAQLYLHGVIAGILRSVTGDAAALLHGRARTFSHAAAARPAEDPQLLQVLGELSSSAFAAEAIVLAAADAQDRAFAAAAAVDPALGHEASLRAAQAKVVVDALALEAASRLFEVGGSSAARQSAQLDRHWRNIRTLASHNPALYKARAIGDYEANGRELPRNAYF
ncbi:acyl-CoA dehydrogenase family protein [Azotobacter chroococcum]|uniref:acyl-CoA dehydrogenase family protein n=1 Tax=Azotobacter chroococcum TaxID=353 RepID=UPI0010ADC75D|nr:acyl-CoA dehydrogenase family protein [Azotobacter chroococcum]TKD32941.1 acyl-CoA dehydrogenase [Azotobacter chroococcum]